MNTLIPKSLKFFFIIEIKGYNESLNSGDLKNAWVYLERAHIIGQKYPYEHSLVHWKMLLFGFKIKSTKEIFGQIPRLLFGGIKSFVGKIPVGNTGGSNIPPLKPLPIPKDIKEMFYIANLQE